MHRTRRPSKPAESGFTLIELLVVVIIIGILAGIAIPIFMNQKAKAHDAAVKSDLSSIAKAIETGGTALVGTLYRAAGNAAVVDATGNSTPVKLSDGTGWGVTGTPASYCISGWSLDGSHDAADPLTYDSAAGGLERDGKACNLASLPVTSIPWSGGGGTVYPAGRNTMPDSGFQNVTPAKLDAVIPIAETIDGVGYSGSGQWRFISTQTPVGMRAVQLVTSVVSGSQGTVFYPDSAFPMGGTTPTVIDGQVYTLSVFMLAPAGQEMYLTARVVHADRTWVAEDYSPIVGTGAWQRVERTWTGTPATAGQYLALQMQTYRTPWPVLGTPILTAGPQIELGDSSTPFEVTAP